MKSLIYILLFVSLRVSANTPKVLSVVSRPIEREYRYTDEFLLEIDAEKANIEIKVVDGNTVKLILRQSAKNVDVKIAEKDLGFIFFSERKDRNRLYLRNYAQLSANSQGLTSIINNRYVIEVPRHCHLKIKNELGSVSVVGAQESMRFNLNYSSLSINDCSGKLYVDSRIGDVTVADSELQSELLLDNIELKLQRCKGSVDLNAQFGTVSCVMIESMSVFNAQTEHCELTFINRTDVNYSYAIDVYNAQLVVLDDILKDDIIKKDEKMSLHRSDERALGTIVIHSEFADVNLY